MSSVGDVCLIENSKVHILTWDFGRALFMKKKAPIATNTIRMAMGFMMVVSEMPEDLSAVNSTCSPRSPKVISAANKILSGKANGSSESAAWKKSSAIRSRLSPFPTSSSIYRHRNCMMTIKRQMQKVIRNLGKNLDNMNVYSLLILNI